MEQTRPRDIDYAADAVKNAIVEKFGRKVSVQNLIVIPHERTISVAYEADKIEGTRDQLLAAVRRAEAFQDIWRSFPATAPRV
jgi:hypothetical protein